MGRAFVVNDWYITRLRADPRRARTGHRRPLLRRQAGGRRPTCARASWTSSPARPATSMCWAAPANRRDNTSFPHKGQRDGENIWDAKDADGNLFIQSIVDKALATKNGECDFERYPWRNKGETRRGGRSPPSPTSSPGTGSSASGPTRTTIQRCRRLDQRALNQLLLWGIGGGWRRWCSAAGSPGVGATRMTRPLVKAVAGHGKGGRAATTASGWTSTARTRSAAWPWPINTAVEATEKAMQRSRRPPSANRRLQGQRAEAEQRQAEAERKRQAEEAEAATPARRGRTATPGRRGRQGSANGPRPSASRRGTPREGRSPAGGRRRRRRGRPDPDRSRSKATKPSTNWPPASSKMLADLAGVIGQVTESADQFTEGSRVIAESSQIAGPGRPDAKLQRRGNERLDRRTGPLDRDRQGQRRRGRHSRPGRPAAWPSRAARPCRSRSRPWN